MKCRWSSSKEKLFFGLTETYDVLKCEKKRLDPVDDPGLTETYDVLKWANSYDFMGSSGCLTETYDVLKSGCLPLLNCSNLV